MCLESQSKNVGRATQPDERGGKQWTRRGRGEDSPIREAAKVGVKCFEACAKADVNKYALGGWFRTSGR